MGKNSQPPDPSKSYCAKQPFVDKDGCDIYGKSLALEKSTKKFKPTKEFNPKTKQAPESRSGSDASRANSPIPGKDSKPAATSVPSGKCPYCPRYMAFTRIAQHMDRCQNTHKRNSRKDTLSNKFQSSTPRDSSRASTPRAGVIGTKSEANRPLSSQEIANNVNGKKRKIELGSEDDGPEPLTPVMKKKKILMKKKSPPAGAKKTIPAAAPAAKIIADARMKKDKDAAESLASKEKKEKESTETKESNIKRDKDKASATAKAATKRPPGAQPISVGKIKDG